MISPGDRVVTEVHIEEMALELKREKSKEEATQAKETES